MGRLTRGVAAGAMVLLAASTAAAHPGSGIVVDRAGNVYFVIAGSNVIMRLTRDGQATAFVTDERLRLPHHLVLGRDGTLYAASDHDGVVWSVNPDGSLGEYFNSNRAPRPTAGQSEIHVGSWGDPFTLDSVGNVYALAAPNASALIRITREGRVTTVASGAPFGQLHFSSMAWAADGSLFLTDENRVWRIAGDSAIPIVPRGAALSLAAGLAIDGTGNVYVADYRAGRMVRFAANGSVNTPREIERMSLSHPVGVTVAGDDVYVLDSSPGGVSIWRVHGGKAERLYSKRSAASYRGWAFASLVLLLAGLITVRIYQRVRQRLALRRT